VNHPQTSKPYPYFTHLSQGAEIVGMSRSTLLRREKDDPTFPRRRRLGPGQSATAYITTELLDWAASRQKIGD
jgi:predicted DNA-binding transcriptional regulator AlpA